MCECSVGVCRHAGGCFVNRVRVCVCVLGRDWLAQCGGVQMESNRVRRTGPLQAVVC